MVALSVNGIEQLASFFHGLSEDDARTLWRAAVKAEHKSATAAVYFTVTRNAKNKRTSFVIQLTVDESDTNHGFAVTDDYRPRKDGKADFVIQSDYVYDDND
jgi:anti-sigma-K factor RskA